MRGTLVVFRKELADYFSSKRFAILFIIVFLAALSAVYGAAQQIRTDVASSPEQGFVFLRLFTSSGGVIPPFISFIGFFGPLVGLVFGFDAINREQTSGTLSRVIAQPLYRDSVINGKFLAGVATVSILLLAIVTVIGGLGLRMIGIPPSIDEIWRIAAFLVISIVYIAFWMNLAILFSIFFKRPTTSALAGIAVWMFLTIFMGMVAGLFANYVAPVDAESSQEAMIKNAEVNSNVMRISPSTLYEEATFVVLTPTQRTISIGGMVQQQQSTSMLPGPLPLKQSLLIVWPHLSSLVALMFVCFGISYIGFMRREIRAA